MLDYTSIHELAVQAAAGLQALPDGAAEVQLAAVGPMLAAG